MAIEGSASIVEYKAEHDGKYYSVVLTAAHNMHKDQYAPRTRSFFYSARHGTKTELDFVGEIVRVEYPPEYKEYECKSPIRPTN